MPKDLIVNIDGMNISVAGQKKFRICIGIPARGSVDVLFFHTMLLRMEDWSQIFEIVPTIETKIPIDEARNRIAKTAIENECDYVFFIDADVLIQKGQLEKLLSWQKDAITGVYYMRMQPYYSLIRKKIAPRLYAPVEVNGTELMNIDAAGFGCFLLKTSVFEKIEYPWFQFKYFKKNDEWRHLGEDLYFCEQLKNTSIDIFCDPTVQCTHTGADVPIETAKMFKDLRSTILNDIEKCKEDLVEFTGLSLQEVSEKCFASKDLVIKQFRRDIIDHEIKPDKFYKENKDYIFNLINLHIEQRRMFDMNLVDDIKKNYPSTKKILDFGCGVGQNAIMLAQAGYDVSIADYDGYMSQFARFRAKKRGLNIKFYDIEMPINDKFDIILALDVFDRIPDIEFEKTVHLIDSLKYNGGKILITTNFDPKNPMCYPSSPKKLELIEKLTKENKDDKNIR